MNLFLQNDVSNLKPLETSAEVVIQSQKDAWKENSAGGQPTHSTPDLAKDATSNGRIH